MRQGAGVWPGLNHILVSLWHFLWVDHITCVDRWHTNAWQGSIRGVCLIASRACWLMDVTLSARSSPDESFLQRCCRVAVADHQINLKWWYSFSSRVLGMTLTLINNMSWEQQPAILNKRQNGSDYVYFGVDVYKNYTLAGNCNVTSKQRGQNLVAKSRKPWSIQSWPLIEWVRTVRDLLRQTTTASEFTMLYFPTSK